MKRTACTVHPSNYGCHRRTARASLRRTNHCRSRQPTAPRSSNQAAVNKPQPSERNCPSPSSCRSTMSRETRLTGALVVLRGPNGVFLDPAAGLTDSSGQFTSNVSLGTIPGRYQLTANTTTKAGKNIDLKIEEIGLGYQEMLGSQLNDQYCARCHDQESTPERVSNYDNLETKPHPFTEGDTLNKMSDADLMAIISHGGPALNKSPLMAPYGYTLSKSEIQALIAYIRMVSDPPYGAPGIVYVQK